MGKDGIEAGGPDGSVPPAEEQEGSAQKQKKEQYAPERAALGTGSGSHREKRPPATEKSNTGTSYYIMPEVLWREKNKRKCRKQKRAIATSLHSFFVENIKAVTFTQRKVRCCLKKPVHMLKYINHNLH